MEIETLVNTSDPWELIDLLVNRTIANKVNTILPAEVVEIDAKAKGGRASVQSLVMTHGAKVPAVIFHNVPVLQPAGKRYRITQPVNPGDRGLLLTCKLDISKLKETDAPQVAQYPRVFDRNDSVFLPLALQSVPLTAEAQAQVRVEYLDPDGAAEAAVTLSSGLVEIASTRGIKVQADGEAGVLVKADKIILDCDKLECGPLADALAAVQVLLDALAAGMAGSGTNRVQYDAQKPLQSEAFKKVQGKQVD